MSLRRVFVDRVAAGKASVSGERAHHLARVARLQQDEHVEVTDHEQLFTARVVEVGGDFVEFAIEAEIEPPPLGRPVRLLLSLIKFARFEWAIEKTTEIGVTSIVPLLAAGSDRGLAAAAGKRTRRWARIAAAAAQQARRMAPPIIAQPTDLAQALAGDDGAARFILDREGEPLAQAMADPSVDPAQEVVLMVGPEGGWSDREMASAQSHGFVVVGLGPNVLRTETAAVAAMAVATGTHAGPVQ